MTCNSVALAACPNFTNKIQIDEFECMVFFATYVSITEKGDVCPLSATEKMVDIIHQDGFKIYITSLFDKIYTEMK